MTKEEIIEKYGKVVMHFYSYYKYVFSFYGEAPDGTKITAHYGGHGEDIYRHNVQAAEDLERLCLDDMTVEFPDGTKLEFPREEW